MLKPMSAAEIIRSFDFPTVRRDGEGNVEFCIRSPNRDDWHYWIPEAEIETRRGLIRWINHLCGKTWVTSRHIQELIHISHQVACKK